MIQAADKGGTVGADGSACGSPFSFATADGWKAKAVRGAKGTDDVMLPAYLLAKRTLQAS